MFDQPFDIRSDPDFGVPLVPGPHTLDGIIAVQKVAQKNARAAGGEVNAVPDDFEIESGPKRSGEFVERRYTPRKSAEVLDEFAAFLEGRTGMPIRHPLAPRISLKI